MDASPKCINRVANCFNHVANCVNHVPTSCIFRILTSCIFSVTSNVKHWPNIDLWPHAYSAWPLTSNPSRDLTSRCCEFATQLKQFATIDEIRGIWRHAVANLQRNWSNSRRLTKFVARLTQFATMIILISNIDLVEYRYTALLVYLPLEIFSTVASLKPRPEYWILTTADQ